MDDKNKDKLFACITATSFVLDDLRLFLDTHPTDQAALEYWKRMDRIRNEAVEEYTKCYGPMNSYMVDSENKWEWVRDPWPWEARCWCMWSYERRLQHPVNITQCNPKLAQVIISQFGGPDGELAASMRYISQMYSMSTTNRKVAGLLLDIGTEELGHMEMIGAIVHQLTRDLSPQQIVESGFDKYYVDHTLGLYHVAASGTPFTASYYQSKGDPITDLIEDMAAEQKARTTYDNILRLVHDQEVCDPIRFLREREIVHFQRFGEALRMIQDELDSKNFYAFNPSFDKAPCK